MSANQGEMERNYGNRTISSFAYKSPTLYTFNRQAINSQSKASKYSTAKFGSDRALHKTTDKLPIGQPINGRIK